MDGQTVFSNHSRDILLKLNDDRKTSTKYCDITLIVDDHIYPAHKCVLGVLSPFFNKMFSIKMKERRENKAVIKGVKKEVFEAILDFVYTSSITLNMENVFGMIEAAHYMDLPHVKECCTTYLSSKINAKNWFTINAYGKRFGYEELLDKVDETLSEKFNDIMNANNFVELEIEELKHLLSLEGKHVESEEKLYKAVIGWIKMDVLGREKYVEELLGFVKFSEMSLEFLNGIVAKEKLIENSHACLKSLFRAIGNHKSPLPKPSDVAELPSTSRQNASILQLKDFVAVDSKTVWKSSERGLDKTLLKYNHAGGSAVKKGLDVLVISGSETKQIECVSKMKLINTASSSNYMLQTKHFRFAAASVVINNGVYVTGGLNTENSAETCSNSIPQLHTNMKFNRHGHAIACMCNAVYVFGGKNTTTQSTVCFNPQTTATAYLPQMNHPRLHLTAIVFDQEIYVIGGNYNGQPSRIVEKFNPLTYKWQIVASLNVARYRPGACVIDDRIVVAGGGSDVLEVYDKQDVSKSWKIIGKSEELKNVFAIFPYY